MKMEAIHNWITNNKNVLYKLEVRPYIVKRTLTPPLFRPLVYIQKRRLKVAVQSDTNPSQLGWVKRLS
jgi:hypothetical protein